MVRTSVGVAASTTDTVDREDVQGIVVRAYKRLPEARYLLAEIRSAAQARAWLGWACDRITTGGPHTADHAVNVAFTASGLRKLGLAEQPLAMFSNEFLGGMTEEHRSRALGDHGDSAPERWEWGAPGGAPIEVQARCAFFNCSSVVPIACSRRAPDNCAPHSEAPVRSALCRFAPERSAWSSFALWRPA